jgi:hypothetical protein
MTLPTPPIYDGSNSSWSQIHQWAAHNHSVWHAINRAADMEGLTEVQALRRLAVGLLHECCERRNKMIQDASQKSFILVEKS